MTMNAMLKTIRKEMEDNLNEEKVKKLTCENSENLLNFVTFLYDEQIEFYNFYLSSITIKDDKITTRFILIDDEEMRHRLILNWKEA